MEITEVEILGTVTTSQYGTLTTGTILRTNPEFAKHLVDDCGAAKYIKQKIVKEEKNEDEKDAKKGHQLHLKK